MPRDTYELWNLKHIQKKLRKTSTLEVTISFIILMLGHFDKFQILVRIFQRFRGKIYQLTEKVDIP